MNVIVDTSVWSHALRRKSTIYNVATTGLSRLLDSNNAIIIGPIRQELLTGFRNELQFEKLKSELRQFPDHLIFTEDYELAAELSNTCGKNGIQSSPVDILICAVALNNEMKIFTLDKDFVYYQKVIPIKLY